MENSVREAWCDRTWDRYKEELSDVIQEAIDENSSEKETMAIMLEMLKIAKLKAIIQQDDDMGV